jgi:Cu2+-exporting ATPase
MLADRIASYIVVALLLVATVVAAYWYLTDPGRAFVITLSVLVVTCPCALALATPAAFATAGSRFSQLQLLVTNGDAIEVLSRATHIVFDKTGTLTSGRPALESVTVFDDNHDRAYCLRVASALEQASSHPIAHAFRSDKDLPVVTDPTVHIAEGVNGTVDGQFWHIGKAGFAFARQDESVAGGVYLGANGRCVARFDISDPIRPGAHEALNSLSSMGITLSLASGDHEQGVAAVADSLGITDFRFDCTPEDKLKIIKELQARGERVVMVGDGINDAPVLAGADASIAPAHGALLAQTSADVIMLGESLHPLVTALTMSRKTLRIVRQNLVWALVYNVTALPLAVAGLVPPWLAAIGMSASSLIVVLNALRLNRFE